MQDSQDRGPVSREGARTTKREPAPVLSHMLTNNLIRHDDRILCYGCGQGVDVEWLQMRRFPAQGYDPHPPFGRNEAPEGLYGVVFFNYVLTRLKTPETRRDTLRRAFSHVKPGGRFVITSRTAVREAGRGNAAAQRAFFEELTAGMDVAVMELLPENAEDGSAAVIIRKGGTYTPQTPWEWVETREGLEQACALLGRCEVIGLDVETTLEEPRVLCTIQIAAPGRVYIIDALAFSDLSPVRAVMENKAVTKVIHNALFEEQMLAKHNIKILNVYDTLAVSRKRQRKGQQGGHKLGEVCERELNIHMDKQYQTSDWTKRPLTPEQLLYAAADAEVLLLLHRVFEPPKGPENMELF